MIRSIAAARSAAPAGTAVVPQSQVSTTRAPSAFAAATPAGPKSYPSRIRSGMNGVTLPPSARSALVISVVEQMPSTS